MSATRFLFVVVEGPDATVIDSQVVDAIVAVGREGVPFDLRFYAEPRPYLRNRRYYARRRSEIAARTGGSVEILPVPRKRSRLGSMIVSALLARELRRSPGRRLVVHARTDWSGYFASRVARRHPGFQYVFDCRGDGPAEFRLHATQLGMSGAEIERRTQKMLRIRGLAIAGAAHVLCVSTVLRDELVARHQLDPARVTVVPCVADADKFRLDEAERARARRELGFDDRFVVVYPGRFGAWHYNEETFGVVRGLMDADPSVFFLVLTPDTEIAHELATRTLPAGRWAIQAAQHTEVPRYLRASDLGILLRAPHPLNAVACPTKFAEYVLTGLPVLISAGIGDCSGFVAAQNTGVVLDSTDPRAAAHAVATIRAEPAEARRTRIAEAANALSRQVFAREMAILYRRIAESF